MQDYRRSELPTVTPIGAAVRKYRNKIRLSQNQFARAIGVDPAWIHRIETGRTNPSRTVILAIAARAELSNLERDRLLYLAGHAPVTDWQAAYEELSNSLAETLYDTVQKHRSKVGAESRRKEAKQKPPSGA